MNDEELKPLLEKQLRKVLKRVQQEMSGLTGDVVRQHLVKSTHNIARRAWRISNKHVIWKDKRPVMFNEGTKLFYVKGNSALHIIENKPRRRNIIFHDQRGDHNTANNYNIAFPYVHFIIHYKEGRLSEYYCSFSNKSLANAEEAPCLPCLPNIESMSLRVCRGNSLNVDDVAYGDYNELSERILQSFWRSAFSNEWNENMRTCMSHDSRLATLDTWEQNSEKDPLFVLGIDWPKSRYENYGELFSGLLKQDSTSLKMNEELFSDLVEGFVSETNEELSKSLNNSDNSRKSIDRDVAKILTEIFGD